MGDPWYRSFFDADYWRYADRKYPPMLMSEETARIAELLDAFAPGKRVLDLGCGVGHHAIGLAKKGFQLTGLDISDWAIQEATRRAKKAKVGVQWHQVDVLSTSKWPLGQIDAAICIRALGWGSDANQRSVFREIRRYLIPDGVLIILQPDSATVISNLTPSLTVRVDDMEYLIKQSYDPIVGRICRRFVLSNGEDDRMLLQDQRLYSPVEIAGLVRDSGFHIRSLELCAPSLAKKECPSIQLIASALPVPADSLAVTTWRTPQNPGFELRYAPDETPWLDPKPTEIWQTTMNDDGDIGTDAVGHYAVDDPYGAQRGANIIAQHFGSHISSDVLTFGAGVTSLLHSLAGLADRGLILAPRHVHPDIAAWAVSAGSQVKLVDEHVSTEQWIIEIERSRPHLVHFDRPNFVGELMTLDDVKRVCRAAACIGAVVLIDESPASCLGPSRSAVQVTCNVTNLVVLRGLTKAYSFAGARVAFAVASGGIAPRVRNLIPPLQVSEPAFRAVLRLLAAGDIFDRFRKRVREVKPWMARLLEARGLNVLSGHADVPWLVVSDIDGSNSQLFQSLGMRGLRPAPLPTGCSHCSELLHLSIPLSDERVAEFKRLIGQQRKLVSR